MENFALGAIASLFYALGFVLQVQTFRRRVTPNTYLTPALGLVAACFHGALTLHQINANSSINFGLFNSSLTVGLAIAILSILIVLSSEKLRNSGASHLILITYPVAALSILMFGHPHEVGPSLHSISNGLFSHIVLSITAYSLLMVAAMIALAYHFQNKHLKTHHNSIVVRNLPPLMTVESLLFATVWFGWILLTAAILTGMVFIDDFRAQHIAHKAVFSIMAWLLFGTLLVGHHLRGWRALTASRWTLWGSFFLMLGFFGTKLVLEVLLSDASGTH